MEEENKSFRFLGLANTPLANASLDGGGGGGLDSRQVLQAEPGAKLRTRKIG